ncbi:unnamed protein product [Amoebophrya sp. A25]|nr:unnamed protein product [Amoebophrya sp. A25]|eukprot:GSA25T00013065001.1
MKTMSQLPFLRGGGSSLEASWRSAGVLRASAAASAALQHQTRGTIAGLLVGIRRMHTGTRTPLLRVQPPNNDHAYSSSSSSTSSMFVAMKEMTTVRSADALLSLDHLQRVYDHLLPATTITLTTASAPSRPMKPTNRDPLKNIFGRRIMMPQSETESIEEERGCTATPAPLQAPATSSAEVEMWCWCRAPAKHPKRCNRGACPRNNVMRRMRKRGRVGK